MPRHQATPIRRAPGCLWAKAGSRLGTLRSLLSGSNSSSFAFLCSAV